MDSVRAAVRDRGSLRAYDVLMQAQHFWSCMDRFRRDRERNKRYCYGDQWRDWVEVDGCRMTEEEYIVKQGNIPLKNNLIRRLVNCVLGAYRSQSKEPTCHARDRHEQKYGETLTTLLQYNMQLNRMTEMQARAMEEFLISGLIVERKSFSYRNDKLDCWTDYVHPNNFFVDNNMRDFRGWDVSCLGEVHDIDFDTLCATFAESPADYERFRSIYMFAQNRDHIATTAQQFGYSLQGDYSFLVPRDASRCRVIEVWRKESKPRYRCHDFNTGDVYKIEVEDYGEMVEARNAERMAMARQQGIAEDDVPLIEATWMMDTYWYFYYLSPFGDILKEGETPYAHKSHPYVFKGYPFIDGEIHSFVNNVIDQQRYVNRLITLYDFIMRSSAKGVLMFPDTALPDGVSMDDIADQWSRFDGIIVYKPKAGVPMPQQISQNSTNVGITELLGTQLKFFEDISGVNGALQGKPGYSGMSASLYSQQTQNATTSLLDILECFSAFVRDGAMKDVKNIQQFYDDGKILEIVGDDAWTGFSPQSVRDIDFDLNIVESTNTPAYRMMANDILMQLYQSQAITVEQLLEQGDFPFADNLLQSIQANAERAQQMKNEELKIKNEEGRGTSEEVRVES
jgi:hypothetical protein